MQRLTENRGVDENEIYENYAMLKTRTMHAKLAHNKVKVHVENADGASEGSDGSLK